MKYTCKVEIDELGEYYIVLPGELLKEVGWNIDDMIEWIIEGDSIVLSRKEVNKNESDSSN